MLPNNIEALRNYFAQVSLIDSGVGRIQAALERFGFDENTVVIYTSDHEFSLEHNGVWGHGAAAFPTSAHRPSYHIPLIVLGGAVVENTVCDTMVSQINLFPTLAALAAAQHARPRRPSNARDLGPALRGDVLEWGDVVFCEQEETRAIQTSDWLYPMRYHGAVSYPMGDALYALSDNPEEKVNLIENPE